MPDTIAIVMREYYQLLSVFVVLSLYAQVTGSTHDKEAQ
jgi:hypothetical protein